MIELLVWIGFALALAGAGFVAVLTLRRLALTRSKRLVHEEEERLRPLALALVDGDTVELPELSERSARVLAGLLGRYSRWLAGDARRQIGGFFERTGGLDAELRALADRRAWRRATAAYALGDMASPGAEPALLRALRDPAREVRAAAARSLGRLGCAAAVEPIVYALAEESIPRAAAGSALLSLGPAALPALRELERRAEPEVRAFSVELVGLVGDASDGPLLVERLRDSSAETRAKAARALGRLAAEDAAAALRDALDDRIPFVRAAAAHAAGLIGDPEAAPRLLELAREDTFDAAHAAAHALARVAPELVRREAASSPHLAEAADLLEFR